MRDISSLISVGLVVWVLAFLLVYVLIYAYKPPVVLFTGPDKRKTTSVCMRRAVVSASVMALLLTVLVLCIVALAFKRG